MMMKRPRALAIPPISALPYPRSLTGTTRAPIRSAMDCEPSVLPLSATMISPLIFASLNARCAFAIQRPSVSASLRHGITTETSTWFTAGGPLLRSSSVRFSWISVPLTRTRWKDRQARPAEAWAPSAHNTDAAGGPAASTEDYDVRTGQAGRAATNMMSPRSIHEPSRRVTAPPSGPSAKSVRAVGKPPRSRTPARML